MADKHQRLVVERNDGEFGILDGIRDETQVGTVPQDILVHLISLTIFDVDVHGRIALQEFPDKRGQVMQPDAVNGRDLNGAGDDVLELLQFAVQRLIGLDDLLAVIVEHLAFLGEPELLSATFNQPRLESARQSTDRLADSGLRDPADLGGLGEAFRFSEVAEHF